MMESILRGNHQLNEKTNCRYCKGPLVKHGKTPNQKQCFYYKKCGRTQLKTYHYWACASDINPQIIALLKEGVGIRGMARLLSISTTTLIPSNIHSTRPFGTNHIERIHLNLRTHLKRLNRRSIGFSRSQTLLTASLKIYFWG